MPLFVVSVPVMGIAEIKIEAQSIEGALARLPERLARDEAIDFGALGGIDSVEVDYVSATAEMVQ
ncbi:MAG: hypothetical protein ACK5OQ_16470 [Burkholderiales bacterium]|jgi:hypothetical protein